MTDTRDFRFSWRLFRSLFETGSTQLTHLNVLAGFPKDSELAGVGIEENTPGFPVLVFKVKADAPGEESITVQKKPCEVLRGWL